MRAWDDEQQQHEIPKRGPLSHLSAPRDGRKLYAERHGAAALGREHVDAEHDGRLEVALAALVGLVRNARAILPDVAGRGAYVDAAARCLASGLCEREAAVDEK